ncbi:MAG: protein kinase [Synechococcales cyanobacterium C42_A2020_086]|jgi:serine/threonine protein kinase|nr:protein kinase [Synechococcales cyanobacterium C42_A2020_086]
MSDLPDFLPYGYEAKKELGANRAGGRVTYLATALSTQEPVVIKQFQFARSSAGWSGYDAYHREIEVLQGLDHPGIPRYLDSFQTEAGFCMVQEYKNAQSLKTTRSFSPDDVKQIAVSALEILIYLQNRIPPVIHRDIKPENILVDEQMQVYLVDFGFARVGDGEVGVSSVVKGTLGFMPPEQLFNRQLTEASDLYGLGVTLICLLTKTQSEDIGNLVDISYRVSFKHLLPKLSIHWITWLERMVEPKVKDRFANAATALAALPSSPLRLPEARFSESALHFAATQLGEQIRHTVTITNLVPDTVLEGKWEVAPHTSDPPHTPETHAWIAIQPASFRCNQVDCQITLNTYRLMADKVYQRTLLLHTNSFPKTYSLTLHVRTAPVPIRMMRLPYSLLVTTFLGFGVAAWIVALLLFMAGTILDAPLALGLGGIVGSAIGLQLAAWVLSLAGASVGAVASVIAGSIMAGLALISVISGGSTMTGLPLVVGVGIGVVAGGLAGGVLGSVVEKLVERHVPRGLSTSIVLITAAAGLSMGLCFAPGVVTPLIVSATVGIGLLWAATAAYLPLQRQKLISAYREFEQHLIKP